MKTIKRTFTTTLALVLALLMAIYLFPADVAAAAHAGNDPESQTNEQTEEKAVDALFELTDLRTADTKYIKMSDGTIQALVYETAVHAQDENGVWQDINNCLTVGNNTVDSARVKFQKQITGNGELFTLHDGNKKVTLSLADAIKKTPVTVVNDGTTDEKYATKLEELSTLSKVVSSVRYNGILPNTDVEYILSGNDLKENIVINALQDYYTYTFELALNNLTAVLSEDGSIVLSEGEETVYTIPVPYMYDAEGAFSDAVSYTLTEANGNGKYILTVTADTGWINDESRILPVTVDPTIFKGGRNLLQMRDTYVSSSHPSTAYGSNTFLRVGYDSSYGITRSYVALKELPTLPKGFYLSTAKVHLETKSNMTSIPYTLYLGACPIDFGSTSLWTESGTTWNTHTAPFTNYLDYVTIENGNVQSSYSWDITNIARKWYDGSETNLGIAIGQISEDTNAPYAYISFHSSESTENNNGSYLPFFSFSFVDTKGIEDYYSYLSSSVGKAGNGYINQATGALTFTTGLLTTTDSIFSFSPTIVYNSSLAGLKYQYPNAQISYWGTYMPYGFKLNIQETIILKAFLNDENSTEDTYIWSDSDGTEHYFHLKENSTTDYEDEDGLQYTLKTGSDNTLTISNDAGVVKTYNSLSTTPSSDVLGGWYLKSIKDAHHNVLSFDFDSGIRPIKVKITPSGGTTTTQLTIAYNGSNMPYVVWNETTKEAIILKYSQSATSTTPSTSNCKYLCRLEFAQGVGSITSSTWYNYYYNNNSTGIQINGIMSYEYDSSGRLTSVKDGTSNYSVQYTWTNGKVTSLLEKSNDVTGQEVTLSYSNNYTEVRTSGSDDIYGTNDDILTRYIFDKNGRVSASYSTDYAKTKIYGASSGVYESEKKIKNNIKTATTIGGSTSNYLINGNFETVDITGNAKCWYKSSNVSYATTSFHPNFMNEASFDIQPNTTDYIKQYVKLPAGTYTLSFTVDTYECDDVSAYIVVSSLNYSSHIFEDSIPVSKYYAAGIENHHSFTFDAINYNSTGVELFCITIKVIGGANVSNDASISFDDVMLEEGIGSSDYCLIQLGNFEKTSINANAVYSEEINNYWSSSTGNVTRYNYGEPFGFAARVDSSVNNERYIKQTIYQTTSNLISAYNNGIYQGDDTKTYIVSGFAKGTGQVSNERAKFRIRIDVTYYTGSNSDDIVIPYYYDYLTFDDDWQFVCGNFETIDQALVKSIDLYCEYSYQPAGYALFDNISVIQSTDESVVKYEYYGQTIAGDERPENAALDGLLRSKKAGYYTEFYEYNNNRRLTRIANNRGELHDYEYNGVCSYDVSSEITYSFTTASGGRLYPYLKQNPDQSITKMPKTRTSYSYTDSGLPLQTLSYEVEYNNSGTIVAKSGTKYLKATKAYDEAQGSHTFGVLLSERDSLNKTTYYFYDDFGRLMASVNSDAGSGLCYTYDNFGNLKTIRPATYASASYTGVDNAEKIEYSFDSQNLLKNIKTSSTVYLFNYDTFGNTSKVSIANKDQVEVADRDLVEYEYNSHNGKLSKITYCNGYAQKYYYDELDNIIKISYINNNVEADAYTYTYTAYGQLYRFDNLLTGKSTIYRYNTSGKLTSFVEFDSNDMVNEFSSTQSYNDNGKLSYLTYTLDYDYSSGSGTADHDISCLFSYNSDESIKSLWLDTTVTDGWVNYTYDTFHRLSGIKYDFYDPNNSSIRYTNTVTYSFRESGSYTSTYIASSTSKINNNTAVTTSYTYDDNGNITKITLSSGAEYRYYYNDIGQLIREDNTAKNKTYLYSYDHAGNILSKKICALTAENVTPTVTSTYSYGYTDENWGDLLTTYRGHTIDYDDIGNPINYYNGSTYSFTWKNGRQLASAEKGSTVVGYEYNDQNVRTSKEVNNVVHSYILSGSQIEVEKWGTNLCIYLYDIDGSPIGMQYRNESMAEGAFYTFWFEKNLQGDVIAVYNESGVKCRSYTYNAWGITTQTVNNNSGSNTYAQYNPFRYRGYYYDTELSLYYLNSRYYDPAIGRFINADSTEVLTAASMGLTDKNLFAYCDNNPVARSDDGGEFWHILVGAVIGAIGGAVSSIVSQVVSGQEINWKAVGISAASGAISGAITAACPCMGPVATGIVQGTLSAATYAATEKIAYGRDPSLKDIVKVGITSGLTAGVTKYVGQKLGMVQCFIAGTLVAAKPGLVPIEDIKVGDLVWATDPETGETELKEVVQLFRNETDEWMHITVGDEEIVCTPNHPFYVPKKGWTNACQLRAGDILVTLNGEYVVVEQIQHELLESPETTYNFEVAGFHTYYVGSTTVLVHNICKAAKEAGLPTEGKIRYVPPKNTNGVLPRTSSGGYIDKFGNVWQKGATRTIGEAFEWDVQLSRVGKNMLGWASSDGRHLNVSLLGHITH